VTNKERSAKNGELGRAHEGGREGKEGGGGDGAPFICDVAGVGDGPRAAPRGGEAWGAGVGPAWRLGGVAWPAAARPWRSQEPRNRRRN
jgi:hypothetical protein